MPAPQPNLKVDLCGLDLPGPLLLGSGGLGESAEVLKPYQEAAAGVVIRTLRLKLAESRKIFPSPHLALGPRRAWLLNCEWGNQRPVDYWLAGGLARASSRGPVIVSVSGRDVDDCVATCILFENLARIFEINISCSHAGLAHGRILDDVDHIRRLVASLKAAVTRPVIIKLGWSSILPEIAAAAAQAGADAIAVTNSIGPGLDIDIRSGRPRLGISGGFGGMSGAAIFPIALECVREVAEAVDIPVIGVGGIRSHLDVVKMLMVGATCVQLYTSAFLGGPATFTRINERLAAYLTDNGYNDVAQLRGVALPMLRAESNMIPLIPVVDQSRCTPCGQCVRVCPHDAISLGNFAEIEAAKCTGCGICVDVCPPAYAAISIFPDGDRPAARS